MPGHPQTTSESGCSGTTRTRDVRNNVMLYSPSSDWSKTYRCDLNPSQIQSAPAIVSDLPMMFSPGINIGNPEILLYEDTGTPSLRYLYYVETIYRRSLLPFSDEPGRILEKNSFRRFLDRCLLYTSPSPRDLSTSRMPSSA